MPVYFVHNFIEKNLKKVLTRNRNRVILNSERNKKQNIKREEEKNEKSGYGNVRTGLCDYY